MKSLMRSRNLYTKLQKQYSRKINLQRKRVNLALKKLDNLHLNIKNPINIIGSDGKYSTLKSLQSFIEENKEKVSTFTSPHLYNLRHRFWLKDKFIKISELKKNIKIIKNLKIKLTLFELLNIIYYISASKLKNVSYALVESGLLFAGDSTRVWNKPKCQIITNINKQHLEWVKPRTLHEICRQKVGYLSKNTTIYVGKQNTQTMNIIKKILRKNPSKKIFYGKDWSLKKLGKNRVYRDQKDRINQSMDIIEKNIFQIELNCNSTFSKMMNIIDDIKIEKQSFQDITIDEFIETIINPKMKFYFEQLLKLKHKECDISIKNNEFYFLKDQQLIAYTKCTKTKMDLYFPILNNRFMIDIHYEKIKNKEIYLEIKDDVNIWSHIQNKFKTV